jgi:hypothetical protein
MLKNGRTEVDFGLGNTDIKIARILVIWGETCVLFST